MGDSKDIQALAAETILQICSYLTQKDVASFRLTSKRYGELGAEQLVKELHLMFRPKSFQNLLQIAAHPVFPKYVKCIFYEAAIAHFAINRDIWWIHATGFRGREIRSKRPSPKSSDWDLASVSRTLLLDWEREMELQELYGAKITKHSEAKLTRSWSAFKHIRQETGSIAESNEDFKAMRMAFEQFPNLEEICMQTENKATMAMKLTYKKSLILPTVDILPAYSPGWERGHHYGTRQLSSILKATVAARLKLKSLTVAKLDWSFFGTEPIPYDQVQRNKRFRFDDTFWAAPYEKWLEPAFHNLTDANFRFQDLFLEEDLDREDEEARQILFGEALKSAKNLKSLALHFGDANELSHFSGDLSPTVSLEILVGRSSLDKIIWPHLQFIELHGVASTFKGYTAFMEAHSATLQTLCLSSLRLNFEVENDDDEDEANSTHVSWSRMLTALREILHGKHVEFRGMFLVSRAFPAILERDVDDEGWMSMDRDIWTGPANDRKLVRWGKLLQQWFVDDLGTKNNPVAEAPKLFRRANIFGSDLQTSQNGDGPILWGIPPFLDFSLLATH